MADSDSSLSTPPATDDEMPVDIAPVKTSKPTSQKKKSKKKKNGTILSFFDKEAPSPPRKKRALSPPHEPLPEDSFEVAFIVMFRSRFADAFPPKCPHLGPQDVERGAAEDIPSSQIENLLCALLGLVLNRKKPVEKGHYGRALEEAIQTQKSQWPPSWKHINPLHGGRSFNSMSPSERINLLHTLALWSLNQSEVISAMIKDGYKTRSSKDRADTNIPLSVQPWGRDGDKRRYWLIEGQDDTSFRVYRESNPALKTVTWWTVAGSIDELRVLAKKLEEEDGTREAKSLSERMLHAVPRFEATEEKRKRRQYRVVRKAAFTRPEPGFSLYEGRTRGKRMRYTFSDEEADDNSDELDVRRSTRNSGRETSAAPAGPTVTASGRHVRSRATGLYGETLLSGQTTEHASPATGDYVRSEGSEEPQHPSHGRSTRAANKPNESWPKGRQHIETYNSVDEMDDEDDATSWDGGDEDDDEPDRMNVDDEGDEDEDASDEDDGPQSLVVRLKYPRGTFNPAISAPVVKEERRIMPEAAAQPVGALVGAPVVPLLGNAAVAPEPAPAPALAPGSASHTVPNGTSQASQQSTGPAVVAVAQVHPTKDPIPGESHSLPKLESPFHAPTPPYTAQEAPKPPVHPQQQYPVPSAEPSHPPRPFPPSLPAPTPAASWQ